MPELHDLRPATCAVGEGTEEFTHAHLMARLFDHLTTRASKRAFLAFEFAARQYPALVFRALHDGDQWSRAPAHHKATFRMNGLARHPLKAPIIPFSKIATGHAEKCTRLKCTCGQL